MNQHKIILKSEPSSLDAHVDHALPSLANSTQMVTESSPRRLISANQPQPGPSTRSAPVVEERLRLYIQQSHIHLREANPGFITVFLESRREPFILDTVNVIVVGPANHRYKPHLYQRRGRSVVFSFQPIEPGFYQVGALLNQIHIRDSPETVIVSQNYAVIGPFFRSSNLLLELVGLQPTNICWCPPMNGLLIPCQQLHVILLVNQQGHIVRRFGGHGDAHGFFNFPTVVFYDPIGTRNLVSDSMNYRIQIFSAHFEFQSTFGQVGRERGQLRAPYGVAVSPDGRTIAVADNNKKIQLFDAVGHFIQHFAHNLIQIPMNIVFTASGEFLIFNCSNQRFLYQINIHNNEAPVRVPIHGQLQIPVGLHIDPSGNLIVTDSNSHWITLRNITGPSIRTPLIHGPTDQEFPCHLVTVRGGVIAVLTRRWILRFY